MNPPSSQSGILSQSPFVRTATLLSTVSVQKEVIDLTIGEPRHKAPSFVGSILNDNLDDFRRYPKVNGTEQFRTTVNQWLNNRFHLDSFVDERDGIVALNGSREGLFSALIYAATEAKREGKYRKKLLIPNPYYPVYAATVPILGLDAYLMPCAKQNGYLPIVEDISEKILSETLAVYIASPANPQGGIGDLGYWQRWINAAQRYNFMLFSDECYSEIYRQVQPVSALEAAKKIGNLSNLVVFNSLSKRSNLAGLRCGFSAGDRDFMIGWTAFRNMSAPQVPMPVQAVAVSAYSDESHVIENRQLYNEKFSFAEQILSPYLEVPIPDGGFFLWLDVSSYGNGETVAKQLWEQQAVRVIPGSYLSVHNEGGENPGHRFIRIAMVETVVKTKEALDRIAAFFMNK